MKKRGKTCWQQRERQDTEMTTITQKKFEKGNPGKQILCKKYLHNHATASKYSLDLHSHLKSCVIYNKTIPSILKWLILDAFGMNLERQGYKFKSSPEHIDTWKCMSFILPFKVQCLLCMWQNKGHFEMEENVWICLNTLSQQTYVMKIANLDLHRCM